MGVFQVMEEHTFRASHQLQLPDGSWEPLHEHEWLLRVFVRTETLDDQQLVVDFLDLQAYFKEILASYHNKNINELPPFCDGVNPSAEYIAWCFYNELAPLIDDTRVTLFRVELREAPSSWGIYSIE